MSGGSGDFRRVAQVIFEVKSPPNLFDSLVGLGGPGAPMISPPNSHYIGGPESVKNIGGPR